MYGTGVRRGTPPSPVTPPPGLGRQYSGNTSVSGSPGPGTQVVGAPRDGGSGSDSSTATVDAEGGWHAFCYGWFWAGLLVVFFTLIGVLYVNPSLSTLQFAAPYTPAITTSFQFEKICEGDATIARPSSSGYYSCGYGDPKIGACVNGTCVCQPGWTHDSVFTRTENCGMPRYWIPFAGASLMALGALVLWRNNMLMRSVNGENASFGNPKLWPVWVVMWIVAPGMALSTWALAVSLVVRGAAALEFGFFYGVVVSGSVAAVVLAEFWIFTGVPTNLGNAGKQIYAETPFLKFLFSVTLLIGAALAVQLVVVQNVYANSVTVSNLGLVATTGATAFASVVFIMFGTRPARFMIGLTRESAANAPASSGGKGAKKLQDVANLFLDVVRAHRTQGFMLIALTCVASPIFYVWRVPIFWLFAVAQLTLSLGVVHSVATTMAMSQQLQPGAAIKNAGRVISRAASTVSEASRRVSSSIPSSPVWTPRMTRTPRTPFPSGQTLSDSPLLPRGPAFALQPTEPQSLGVVEEEPVEPEEPRPASTGSTGSARSVFGLQPPTLPARVASSRGPILSVVSVQRGSSGAMTQV